MQHSFIISDAHLSEAIPGNDLWMRYRQKRFFPDGDFAGLLDHLRAQHGDEPLEFIFNGDLFDFDAPIIVDGKPRFHDQPRTEEATVLMLSRILNDHDVFVNALGRWIAAGHRLVFVSGNHDAQLVFEGVRDLLTRRIVLAARGQGATATDEELANFIIYRAWFYVTPAGVHVEHGHQYDWLCSFRYPTEPFTQDGTSVQPNAGSLTTRHLAGRLGYINPYVDRSFMLTLPQYLWHWVRYYLISKKFILWIWLKGAWKTAGSILRHRSKPDAGRETRMVAIGTEESRADAARVREHASFFEPPSEDALFRVMRELWIDRVGWASIGGLAVASFFAVRPLVSAIIGLSVSGGFIGYELLTPKRTLQEIYGQVDARAHDLARLYGSRGVVFGHTHASYGAFENNIFFGNTGMWSAAFHDVACAKPITTGRPVIWLRSKEDGTAVRGGLYVWRDGVLIAEAARSRV